MNRETDITDITDVTDAELSTADKMAESLQETGEMLQQTDTAMTETLQEAGEMLQPTPDAASAPDDLADTTAPDADAAPDADDTDLADAAPDAAPDDHADDHTPEPPVVDDALIARMAEEFLQLQKEFPEVQNFLSLPDEVICLAMEENISLLTAKLVYDRRLARAEAAALQQNLSAAARSCGSQLSAEQPAEDEEIGRMLRAFRG